MPIICRDCKYLDIDYEYDEQGDEYPVYSCGKGIATRYIDRECKYHEKRKPYKYVEEDTECDNCENAKICRLMCGYVDCTMTDDTRCHIECSREYCTKIYGNIVFERLKHDIKETSELLKKYNIPLSHAILKTCKILKIEV